MNRLNTFNIMNEPEKIQKKWVRKTLVAHNHNTGDDLTFEEVWGVWDVRDCGPMKWAITFAKDRIHVYPAPRFPDEFSLLTVEEIPIVEEILGNTCIGNGIHEFLIGDADDIVRATTEELRPLLNQARSVYGDFHWFAKFTDSLWLQRLTSN